MLPKTHIFLGLIFSALLWVFFPDISLIYLLLVFLASFLIDVDHYIVAARINGNPSLLKALHYFDNYCRKEKNEHRKGVKKKGHFFLFHTLEFHIIILLLGFFWTGFIFVFIGMVFHSLLDIFYMASDNSLYRREFFLSAWIRKNSVIKNF